MEISDVSVIIPTYNALGLLKGTLASLELQQPSPDSFEVIVVDDGSSDQTPEFLGSYSGILALRSVLLPANRGRSAARNAGIAAANRKLVLFLDADMLAAPNLVQRHAAMHDGCDIAIIGTVRFDQRLELSGYSRYWEGRGAQRNRSFAEVSPRYFLSGHSSLPTLLARKIGGFDETISFYGEDIDFGMSLSTVGAKVFYSRDVIAEHRHQRSLKDTLLLMEEYGFRTVPTLIRKHPQLLCLLRIDLGLSTQFRGTLVRLAMAPWIRRTATTFGVLLDRWGIPSQLYTYLIYCSYFKGYQRFLEKSL